MRPAPLAARRPWPLGLAAAVSPSLLLLLVSLPRRCRGAWRSRRPQAPPTRLRARWYAVPLRQQVGSAPSMRLKDLVTGANTVRGRC